MTTKAAARYPIESHPLVFAHRYLADGSAEVICMNCLDVICNVRTEAQAAPFLIARTCEIAELERIAQITHPGVDLEQMDSTEVVGVVVTVISKSNRMPTDFRPPAGVQL